MGGEKIKKVHKPLIMGLTVLVFILSIAGIAAAGTGKVQQDIFISITVFSLIAILIALYVKFSGSGDASKYEINEKPEKPAAAGKAGQDNAGFDGEKGGKKEKWADNYIPYGQFPKGTSVEEVRIENEKENKSVEKVLKEDEKWKEAYVPFEGENKEEEKEKE